MRDLTQYRDEELYDYKDRLKSQHITSRDADASYAKWYKRTMLAKVNRELRRRHLPITRPGDTRAYGPGAAAWQRAGGRP